MNALDDILRRLDALPSEERDEIVRAAENATKGMLWLSNPGAQTDAYFSPADELFYGGQAGGGKTDLILGLALNEHTISRIFRKQHNDRQALIERLQEILGTRDGYNGSEHVWRIQGTDKVIRFGAMSEPLSWQRYQGDPTDFKGWDEITQFLKSEYVTVNAWLRTTKPGQRTRIVAAGNPPVTPEGLWVIEHWAPWLDPRHQNPAKAGELRYFTTIDGHEVEVDQYWRGEDKAGLPILPRSRTFIPAGLVDNPDLADTGYASTLAQLPKHLRDALADGKFQASLEDDAWQVIPTEWILMAQQRWEQRKDKPKGPMTCLGVDPAQGGPDETGLQPLYGTFFAETILRDGVDTKNPRAVAAAVFAVMDDDCQVNVDCTGGWGNGPVEHLESNGVHAVACIASKGSARRTRDRKFGFVNERADLIWALREALDPEHGDDVALPPGRRVVAELAAPRWKLVNRDMIQIEAKDDIKKRIGRSPTVLDAIALAWAKPDAERKAERRSTKRKQPVRGHSPSVQGSYDKARERYSKR